MSEIKFIFLSLLLFVSVHSSGKKSEEEIGVFTRPPDNKMPQEFQDYMVWVQKMNHKFNLAERESEEYYKWGKKRATKVISFYKLRIMQEPNEGFTHEKSEC